MAGEKKERDLIQYTLQSYVGPHLADMHISQRQKDAIQRLICLSEDKFEDLCADIVNEIHHRSGMDFTGSGPMYAKLAGLSDDKFRNLVVDTLLVHNYRHPGTETVHMEDFLNNLERLIQNLKDQSLNEKFTEKIKGMGFLPALLEYNRYIRKVAPVDPDIVTEIDRMVHGELELRTVHFLDSLSYPRRFLEYLDKSSLSQNSEYCFRRHTILQLLDGDTHTPVKQDAAVCGSTVYHNSAACTGNTSTATKYSACKNHTSTSDRNITAAGTHNNEASTMDGNNNEQSETVNTAFTFARSAEKPVTPEQPVQNYPVNKPSFHTHPNPVESPDDRSEFRSRLIKIEMQQILSLYMDLIPIPVKEVRCIYPEIAVVQGALDSIKEDLNGRRCVNLENMSDELIKALGPMIEKLSDEQPRRMELLNNLKMHQVTIEGMRDAVTKVEAFKMVVGLAKDVYEILR